MAVRHERIPLGSGKFAPNTGDDHGRVALLRVVRRSFALMPRLSRSTASRLLPGVLVTALLGVLAWLAVRVITSYAARLAIDAVVVAILAGILMRAVWEPGDRTAPGIDFSAKQVLEVAIVLLGLSTDMGWMLRAGAPLAGGIAMVTVLAFGAGLFWGRLFGLAPSHALLVAAGNAICGNSAIAAVAAVTGAPREETASSVAYTAVLSLGLVLLLPLVGEWLALGEVPYGVATGLTVYAVPQVLAAAYPVSLRAGQVGTMVKLVRVLMLIPLVTALAIRAHRWGRVPLHRLVPWYVLAFLLAAGARSAGWIPEPVAQVGQLASHALTIMAMAALGLGVEGHLLRRVGWRTAATATVSLLTLCALAGAVIFFLPELGG